METTTNYQWQLPTGDDELSPEPFNKNFVDIDKRLKNVSDTASLVPQKADTSYIDTDVLTIRSAGIYQVDSKCSNLPDDIGEPACGITLIISPKYVVGDGYYYNMLLIAHYAGADDSNGDYISTWSCQIYHNGGSDNFDAPWKHISAPSVYSKTPICVGQWIDGTPIWRWAFLEAWTAEEKNTVISDKSFTIKLNDIVKNNNNMFIINDTVKLYASGTPCVIDDTLCTNTSSTYWDIPDTVTVSNYDGYYGYIEFVTPKNNLK